VRICEERIRKEIYQNLEALGIDVNALKRLNLSLEELEYFYLRIMSLLERSRDWTNEAN
jgi:nucleoside diphosphate kinase